MSKQFYIVKDDSIVCKLCFRNCLLHEGAVGFCGVNSNSGGTLTSLVYGYPSAMHVDPIEKKPIYHVAPASAVYSIGTVGCNFRCPFCQNASLSFAKPTTGLPYFSPEEVVQKAFYTHCKAIAFTYNEPTVSWLYFRDIAKVAKEQGLLTIMVTNGAMSREVCEDMLECIDAVNIDLKCGSEENYKETLKGDKISILKNLELLHKAGVWIELTTLIVPGLSDSFEDMYLASHEIKELLGIHVPWHVSAYHPAHNMSAPATNRTTLLDRCEQLRSIGFRYVYPGNLDCSSNTLCPACGSIMITRQGFNITNHMEDGSCPRCHRPLEGVAL